MISEKVIGPPGCGKTTWLSRQLERAWQADNRVLVCSLTTTAAKEVASRDLPIPQEAIGTLHAHAYHSLRAGKLEIADDAKHLDDWNTSHPDMALAGGRTLDEDSGYSGMTDADVAYQDYHNMRAKMLPRDSWKGSTLAFARLWESRKREQSLWDFTDLLETALTSVDEAPGSPHVIFADEAQDFSKLEMALLEKWGQAAGRLVVVGDPWQSLYEWRGADADLVFPPNQADIVLKQSYRVPHAVHQAATGWIRRMPGWWPIEYLPTAEPGAVYRCAGTYGQPEMAVDVIERALDQGQSVMYLAATSRMLQPALAVMRKRGIPFANHFRLREGSWNPLAEHKGKASSARRLACFLRLGYEGVWTKDDVQAWAKAIKGSEALACGSVKKLEVALTGLAEPVPQDLWETLLGEAAVEASMASDLDWYLANQLASRRPAAEYPCNIARRGGRDGLLKNPSVTVGTIHSVKGGEADVVLLCPDVSVPGVAEWQSGDKGKTSIYRLFYVGMTRAKQELHVLRPHNPQRAVPLLKK